MSRKNDIWRDSFVLFVSFLLHAHMISCAHRSTNDLFNWPMAIYFHNFRTHCFAFYFSFVRKKKYSWITAVPHAYCEPWQYSSLYDGISEPKFAIDFRKSTNSSLNFVKSNTYYICGFVTFHWITLFRIYGWTILLANSFHNTFSTWFNVLFYYYDSWCAHRTLNA